jgi:hypothetical protein
VHVTTLDAVEYLPTAHGVQMLAPVLVPVLVIEPAAHSMHADRAVDSKSLTCRPIGQPIHDTALVGEKEPDMHALQKVCLVSSVYLPAMGVCGVQGGKWFRGGKNMTDQRMDNART